MLRSRKAAALTAAPVMAMLLIGGPAAAQENTGAKAGFTLRPGTVRIVLMRPTIAAGSQSTGGMPEPNADWTDQARRNLADALRTAQGKLGNAVVDYVEPVGEDARTVAEYRRLFGTVAESVITYQFFRGNRLPTKKRAGSFAWSIGADVGKLPGLAGSDYALFLTTEDYYGSTGRKMLQVVAALARVPVQSGVHKGFAGLIDLGTGELVWLNADLQMGGDVRTPDGARKRVAQLLEGFPGKPAEPSAPQTAAR